MATTASLNLVQEIYLAYYGRPADPAGQTYWANQLDANGGNLSAIINAFGTSAEATALFGGLDPANAVNTLYHQLFGRDADTSGLSFYVNGLQTGKFTLASIALNIAQGASGSDVTVLNNKLAVATAFTAALDTTAEITAYSGSVAADVIRTAIAGVTGDAATVTAAQSHIPSLITTIESVGGPVGTTFTLTEGLNTFVGANTNDVFNAFDVSPTNAAQHVTTLNTYDTLNGGAGHDTLNLYVSDNANDVQAGTVTGIETINVIGQSNAAEVNAAATIADAAASVAYEFMSNTYTNVWADGAHGLDDLAFQINDYATNGSHLDDTVSQWDIQYILDDFNNLANPYNNNVWTGSQTLLSAELSALNSVTGAAFQAFANALHGVMNFTISSTNANWDGGDLHLTSISGTGVSSMTWGQLSAAISAALNAASQQANAIYNQATLAAAAAAAVDTGESALQVTYDTNNNYGYAVDASKWVGSTAINENNGWFSINNLTNQVVTLNNAYIKNELGNNLNSGDGIHGYSGGADVELAWSATGAANTHAVVNVNDSYISGGAQLDIYATHNDLTTGNIQVDLTMTNTGLEGADVYVAKYDFTDSGNIVNNITMTGGDLLWSDITTGYSYSGGSGTATGNVTETVTLTDVNVNESWVVLDTRTGISGGSAVDGLGGVVNDTLNLTNVSVEAYESGGFDIHSAYNTLANATLTLNLNNVDGAGLSGGEFGYGGLTISGGGFNTININTTGKASTVSALENFGGYKFTHGTGTTQTYNVNAAADLTVQYIDTNDSASVADHTVTQFNITGAANVSIANIDPLGAISFNAGTATGNITLGSIGGYVPDGNPGSDFYVGYYGGDSGGFWLGGNVTSVTTGSGNDTVYYAGDLSGGGNDSGEYAKEVTVNLGSGNDKFVIGNYVSDSGGTDGNLYSIGYGGTSVINGGSGVNTISMDVFSASDITAQHNNLVQSEISNFQKLELTTGYTDANVDGTVIDLAHIQTSNAINDVVLAFASGAYGQLDLNGLTSGATLELTGTNPFFADMADNDDLYINVNITGAEAVGHTHDVLNVSVSNNQDNWYLGTLGAAGVETLKFTTVNTASTGGSSYIYLDDSSVTNITVAGNAGLDIGYDSSATKLTSFDASGVTAGGVSYETAELSAAATLTGGAGNDDLDASNALHAVTINGGAGADTLTGADLGGSTLNGGAGDDILVASGSLNTLTGGAGADKFDIGLTASGNSYDTITDFTLTVGSVAGDTIDITSLLASTWLQTNTQTLSTAVHLAGTAAFADYLNAAVAAADSDNNAVQWFQYQGNTYVVIDNTNNTPGAGSATFHSGATTAADQVIQLVGQVNLAGVVVGGALDVLIHG